MCWAHARRRFFESAKSEFKDEILVLINKLFELEKEAWNLDSDQERLAMRLQQQKKIVASIYDKVWAKKKDSFIPASKFKSAIDYLLNYEVAFKSFLDDGSLRIENNVSERAIKTLVIGRKNWLKGWRKIYRRYFVTCSNLSQAWN